MKRILKHARLLFVVNIIIASVLSILGFESDLKLWALEIGHTFVFTFCIGTSIYLFCMLPCIEKFENKFQRLGALLFSFLMGGWIGTAAGIGVNYLLFDFVIRPAHIKIFFFQIGAFNVVIATVVYSYFALKEKLYYTAKKLAEKEVNEQRLQRLRAKAELEALQAKVNPHFLFNTLNSIASLIPVEPEKAEEMLQKLADLLRHTLAAGNRDQIGLKEEIYFVQRYLEIEKIRLGARLSYDIQLDPELEEVELPGLLIQTLVENSVKHGIAARKTGGKIQIECRKKQEYCLIRIKDNGNGFAIESTGCGFGHASIEERLNIHYNGDYEFRFSSDNGGLTLLKIPLKQEINRAKTDEFQNHPD